MEIAGAADEIPEVQREVLDAIESVAGAREIGSLKRFAFYEAAEKAYAVIWTGGRKVQSLLALIVHATQGVRTQADTRRGRAGRKDTRAGACTCSRRDQRATTVATSRR